MTNKEWWEKKIRIWLPDDEIEWESLSWFERYWTIPRLRKNAGKKDQFNADA